MLKFCGQCYNWDLMSIVEQIGLCALCGEITCRECLCLFDKQEEENE